MIREKVVLSTNTENLKKVEDIKEDVDTAGTSNVGDQKDEVVEKISETLKQIERTKHNDFKLVVYGIIIGSLLSGINIQSVKAVLEYLSTLF